MTEITPWLAILVTLGITLVSAGISWGRLSQIVQRSAADSKQLSKIVEETTKHGQQIKHLETGQSEIKGMVSEFKNEVQQNINRIFDKIDKMK